MWWSVMAGALTLGVAGAGSVIELMCAVMPDVAMLSTGSSRKATILPAHSLGRLVTEYDCCPDAAESGMATDLVASTAPSVSVVQYSRATAPAPAGLSMVMLMVRKSSALTIRFHGAITAGSLPVNGT